MVCPQCNSQNDEKAKYCSQCAAPLSTDVDSVQLFLSSSVQRQVRAVLEEQYKDRIVVEHQIAQAVAERLQGWAKIFGYVLGLPLLLITVFFGFVGIQTYADFRESVKSGQDTMRQQVELVQDQMELAQKSVLDQVGVFQQTFTDTIRMAEADVIRSRSRISETLTTIETLAAKADEQISTLEVMITEQAAELTTLRERVGNIESNLLTFSDSFTPVPELQQEINAIVASFLIYWQVLGFDVEIHDEDPITVDLDPTRPGNVMYSPVENTITLGGDIVAHDEDLILWGVITGLLQQELEPDRNSRLSNLVLNALANYFVASYTEDPVIGEETTVALQAKETGHSNLENDLTLPENFQEAFIDSIDYYHTIDVWGGALWDIRQLLGKEKADDLLASVLINLEPESLTETHGFAQIIVESADVQQMEVIQRIFEERGIIE